MTPLDQAKLSELFRRHERSLYAFTVALFTLLHVVPWWLTALVPGHDYTQFLVFVRALRDSNDPSSPFHGTYALAPFALTPTILPLEIVNLLWALSGSLEVAGKLLMSLGQAAIPLALAYLLRVLGRNRWCVLFAFPFLHSLWTSAGFTCYASAPGLLLLGIAWTVRWFERVTLKSALLVALAGVVIFLWHGIAYLIFMLAVAVLWLLWRSPSVRARLLALAPTLPALALFVMWQALTFREAVSSQPAQWMSLPEAFEALPQWLPPQVDHRTWRVIFVGLLLGTALLGSARGAAPTPADEQQRTLFRVRTPALWVAGALLLAYLALPLHAGGVNGICNRFPYVAWLLFGCGFPLPRATLARNLLLCSIAAFSLYSALDMIARFRAFSTRTAGASRLLDRLEPMQTVYGYLDRGGATPEFPDKPILNLDHFATLRHGGLRNSSFAGYGVNVIRYASGKNPMPDLYGPVRYTTALTAFDYVLVQGRTLDSKYFAFVAQEGDFRLYRVCGSRAFPKC